MVHSLLLRQTLLARRHQNLPDSVLERGRRLYPNCMPTMQRQTSGSTVESGSVPLACKPCRDRHVKCDGLQPVCSRCYDSKQYCVYIPSQRGRRLVRNKRPRSQESMDDSTDARRRNPGLSLSDPAIDMGQFAPRMSSPSISPSSLQPPASIMQTSYSNTPRERSISNSPQPHTQRVPQPSVVSPGPSPAQLLELYYFYFHNAHPILIPHAFLPQIQASTMPLAVEAIMCYIGAQYNSFARRDPSHLQRLQAALFSPTAGRNRFVVQALVLLGVVQRAQDRNDLAYETFGQALDIAMELGMNQASFARENSEGSPVIEEMWRRVWWELYINDAMLAATRQDGYSRMQAIEMDAGLPCEESSYRGCNVSPARSYGHRIKELTVF